MTIVYNVTGWQSFTISQDDNCLQYHRLTIVYNITGWQLFTIAQDDNCLQYHRLTTVYNITGWETYLIYTMTCTSICNQKCLSLRQKSIKSLINYFASEYL